MLTLNTVTLYTNPWPSDRFIDIRESSQDACSSHEQFHRVADEYRVTESTATTVGFHTSTHLVDKPVWVGSHAIMPSPPGTGIKYSSQYLLVKIRSLVEKYQQPRPELIPEVSPGVATHRGSFGRGRLLKTHFFNRRFPSTRRCRTEPADPLSTDRCRRHLAARSRRTGIELHVHSAALPEKDVQRCGEPCCESWAFSAAAVTGKNNPRRAIAALRDRYCAVARRI
jgi:hypothetical protein